LHGPGSTRRRARPSTFPSAPTADTNGCAPRSTISA
jgi:hypothetical protein